MNLFKQLNKKKRNKDQDFNMRYATMCRRCNRYGLLEYDYDKIKNLPINQTKKKPNSIGRLTYAKSKIGICLEVKSVAQSNKIYFLATALTYLRQKKLNVSGSNTKKMIRCPVILEVLILQEQQKDFVKLGIMLQVR